MSLTLKSTDQDNIPGPGHNSAATQTDWDALLDPEGLSALLKVEHGTLIDKKDELLARFAKWDEDTKSGFTTREQAQRSQDFGGQIKTLSKKADNAGTPVAGTFFKAHRTVTGFFGNITKPLNDAVTKIERRISEFNAAEAKRLKAIADEEALIKREDAERIAKAATATMNPELLEQAQVVDDQARQAEKVAAAPIAAFSQMRGDFTQSSGSIRYKAKVVDLSLVPREYLMFDESKVNRVINDKKNRVTEIPGVEIEEEFKTTIRA
jgi:hypothetical protein